MVRKKISELESKPALAPTDFVPIVDTELVRQKTKKTTVADLIDAVDAVSNSERGQPGGVAELDDSGKLAPQQLPLRATTEVFNVISEAAMLALTAQTGDIAIRNDIQKTYVLAGNDATNLVHWQEIVFASPSLDDLPDVDVGTTPVIKAALIFDPETNLWRPAGLDKITDGGLF